MADVTGLDVSPGDEVVILGAQGERVAIDAREMAARDRHDSVGDRLPHRLADRADLRLNRSS